MEFFVNYHLTFAIIANIFTFILFIPSLLAGYKNRNNYRYAKNIDNGQLLFMFLSQISWGWYAYIISEPLVAAFIIIELPIALYLFYMKNVKFKKVESTFEKVRADEETYIIETSFETKEKQSVVRKSKVDIERLKKIFVYILLAVFAFTVLSTMFTDINDRMIVALFANSCSLLIFVPSTMSTYVQKDDREFVSNISNAQSLVLLGSSIAWVFYGLSLKSLSVMFSSFLNFPIAVFLLYVKNVRYKKIFDNTNEGYAAKR